MEIDHILDEFRELLGSRQDLRVELKENGHVGRMIDEFRLFFGNLSCLPVGRLEKVLAAN